MEGRNYLNWLGRQLLLFRGLLVYVVIVVSFMMRDERESS